MEWIHQIGQIIGNMSFSSDKLSMDISNPPEIGNGLFMFYESNNEVIIAISYNSGDETAPDEITYEQALAEFGDITIYFGEV